MKRFLLLISLVIFLPLLTTSANSDVQRSQLNNGQLILEDIPTIPEPLKQALNQYQNVRAAGFRGFDHNGQSLFISTRFGDVSQIHRVDLPGGARHQLTFFKEPVGSFALRPEHDEFAFTMDTGGSEYAQIFIFDLKSAKHRMLSDGKSRNGAMRWSNDGQYLAFQSTRRNGRANDIWVMSTESAQSAKMVFESPDGSWWGPIEWSKDNKKLLLQQYVSVTDSRIHLLDLETGTTRLLAGSEKAPATNYGVGFAQNEKGIFYITSQFSDFNQLAYMDFASGKSTVITKSINWNVEDVALSKDKTRAAFSVNEDGIGRLYLLDPESLMVKQVSSLPDGLIGGLDFSGDNKKLGLTMNTAQTPSDSFVLTLKHSATEYGPLTRWTFSEVGGLDTSKFVIPELIRYRSFDGRKIPAFVYKPKKKGPHPVIISIHGGPESQFRPGFRSSFQLWIDELGAAVIAPNVRGSAGYGKAYLQLDNGFKREDSVKDIGALLDWIASQPDLDVSRVAVIGGSYGGYMVLASSVHYSDRLKAAVDIVGISNFVTFLENTKAYRRDLRRAEYGDERDPKMRAHLQLISPNNHVDRIKIPLFVVQGQNDPRVPVTEAEQIVAAMRAAGKPVWYMNALNEGHGYRKKENRDVYQQAVVLFFKQFLLN